MISVGPAGWLSYCMTWENFHVVIFLDAMNVINGELCMVVLLSFTCSYHFRWPWPYFKVTVVLNSLNWKFYVLIQSGWNHMELFSMSSRSWVHHLFWQSHIFKGGNWHISSFEKNFNIGFFSDIMKEKSFKLCIIITLRGVNIIILGLMTLI